MCRTHPPVDPRIRQRLLRASAEQRFSKFFMFVKYNGPWGNVDVSLHYIATFVGTNKVERLVQLFFQTWDVTRENCHVEKLFRFRVRRGEQSKTYSVYIGDPQSVFRYCIRKRVPDIKIINFALKHFCNIGF